MKKIKQPKGVTIVALIVTVVVLLILAVVTITSATDNGIVEYAKNTKTDYESLVEKEDEKIQTYKNSLKKNLIVPEKPVEYTVTFYDDDGTTILATVTVEEGGTAVYPNATPTQSGKTFGYWGLGINSVDIANLENVTSDLNVYAYYTKNKYTITFYYELASGGSNNDVIEIESREVEHGSSVTTFPAVEVNVEGDNRMTYNFKYWKKEDGTQITSLENITSNLNIYAYYWLSSTQSGGSN